MSRTIASETNGLSPNNQATLRRRYLEDFKMLSQLLNDGVLDTVEFTEQKESILNGLRKLTKSLKINS